ncbi:hypothetical protein ABPG77_002251 [Micractinium sp. CCAP 211/92]
MGPLLPPSAAGASFKDRQGAAFEVAGISPEDMAWWAAAVLQHHENASSARQQRLQQQEEEQEQQQQQQQQQQHSQKQQEQQHQEDNQKQSHKKMKQGRSSADASSGAGSSSGDAGQRKRPRKPASVVPAVMATPARQPATPALPSSTAAALAAAGLPAVAEGVVAQGAGARRELQLRTAGTSTESEQPAFMTFQLPSTSFGGIETTCPVRCRFLFQKVLSASDAAPGTGRIIMPCCAANYLPECKEEERVQIELQDSRGGVHRWRLNLWSTGVYLLEGCRAFQQAWGLVDPHPMQVHFLEG